MDRSSGQQCGRVHRAPRSFAVRVIRSATSLHVFSDSELVVKQMTGVYARRSPRLYSLHWTCRKLARSLQFSISHIPRESNIEANRLASSAVRTRAGLVAGSE